MQLGIPMFIACWCMYDIKNPAHRHPDRVDFEKLLKLSSMPLPKNSKEFFGSFERDLNTSASTLVMLQNERSVKSLDDIMDLNEVEDDLKEVKHPNGQICYVEENKSHKSYSSLSKSNGENESDTFEEEKSVIAMLDNVLEIADTTVDSSLLPQIYDRKISVDSEMVPSVIRSTTVATVHSSSRSSDNFEPNSISEGNEEFEEKRKAAQELVDDILNSKELWIALQQRLLEITEHNKSNNEVELNNKNILENLKISKDNNSNTINALNRIHSVESIASTKSIVDPLHSELFRNKLSQLIAKPNRTKSHKDSSKQEKEDSIQAIHPNLKHSKSEADVRELVLNVIEDCDINIKNNNDLQNSTGQVHQYIPKPPKFDPVLYKTINNIGRPKERASLETLLKREEMRTNYENLNIIANEAEINSLPFKEKLEAILKRGPSHKIQTRPNIEERRPKSVGPLQIPEEDLTTLQINENEGDCNKNKLNDLRSIKGTSTEL